MDLRTKEGRKIYELNPNPKVPEWLDRKEKAKLMKNHQKKSKAINFIQDFHMPDATTSIQMTRDQNYIYATGVYKPTVKCFDVNSLSIKFERCMDAEVIKFEMLSKSYHTLAFMQNDRYVEFHAKQGKVHRLRIPFFGRDLAYMDTTGEIYFVGMSSEISRINLQTSRFATPLKTESNEINSCTINEYHRMLTTGSAQGLVECWDPRGPRFVNRTHIGKYSTVVPSGAGVSCMTQFDYYHVGVGTTTGQILIYDIRSDRPLIVREQRGDGPIKRIAYKQRNSGGDIVLSADGFATKMWYKDTGETFGQLLPDPKINDILLIPDTGVVCIANEGNKILSYYVPDLGRPPKWCGALANITEELDDKNKKTDDEGFKFVTFEDLNKLHLSHLIGTNLLRAEMHGFLIREGLYKSAAAKAEQIEKEAAAAILSEEKNTKETKIKKVNKSLGESLRLAGAGNNAKAFNKIMDDDRFADMFSNKEFKVDANSEQFQRILTAKPKKQLSDSEDEVVPAADSDTSDDEDIGLKIPLKKKVESKEIEEQKQPVKKRRVKERKAPFARMTGKSVEVQEINARSTKLQSFSEQVKLSKKTLKERMEEEPRSELKREINSDGNMEVKYVSVKPTKRKRE